MNEEVWKTIDWLPKAKGFYRLSMCEDGSRKREMVHRLVARAFVPGFETMRQINHKDGDRSNNRFDNLEWVTARENVIHAWKIGLCQPNSGESNGNHKMSDREASAALYLMARGVSGKLISEAFGTTQGAVSALKRGKTWKHLTKYKNNV